VSVAIVNYGVGNLGSVRRAFEDLGASVAIVDSPARLDGARLWVDRMVARVGEVDLAGDYRYEPGALRPHRFRLTIPQIDASELERLLLPTLRRDQGFLARTLGIGKSEIPNWLAARFMDGTVQIGEFTAGDKSLNELRLRVLWNGARVDFTDMQARVENGSAQGRLSVDLAGRAPAYRMNFAVDSVDFKGGKIDANGVVRTSGTGAELMSRMRSEGSFTGRALDICKSASGCYRLEGPRLRFTELQVLVGPDLFVGRGATQDDGRLLLQLSSGAKMMRVTGTLAQLAVE